MNLQIVLGAADFQVEFFLLKSFKDLNDYKGFLFKFKGGILDRCNFIPDKVQVFCEGLKNSNSMHISELKTEYRIVTSTNTCYYSENQVFGGVTIRVLCSKRGCY